MTTMNKTKPTHGNFFTVEEREVLKNAKYKVRALLHPLREKILALIESNKNEMNVTEIYVKLRIEQSVASQHLAVLRNENFVKARREGKIIYYSINHDEIKRCINACRQM